MNERHKRMKNIANQILSCCVDKPLLDNIRMRSISGNTDIVIYVNDLLNVIKVRLEFFIQFNFSYLTDVTVPEAENYDEFYKKEISIIVYQLRIAMRQFVRS